MNKKYRVAGHIFELELPNDSPIWSLLGQYDPFFSNTEEVPLFRVEMVEDLHLKEDREILVLEPENDGQPLLNVYGCGEGILIHMAPKKDIPICGKLYISKNFDSAKLFLLNKSKSSSLFAVNNSLMLMYAFATAPYMTLEMHSSVIMHKGKGYMFLGKSGSGKSTHSSLWLKNIPDCELLNDDNPIIRFTEDGTAHVYGSPWSGKTPCYKNADATIGALTLIRQAPFNKITPMNMLEAYATIYSSCSGLKADPCMSDMLHKTIEAIVVNIPCFTLQCLPDDEASKVCFEAVR